MKNVGKAEFKYSGLNDLSVKMQEGFSSRHLSNIDRPALFKAAIIAENIHETILPEMKNIINTAAAKELTPFFENAPKCYEVTNSAVLNKHFYGLLLGKLTSIADTNSYSLLTEAVDDLKYHQRNIERFEKGNLNIIKSCYDGMMDFCYKTNHPESYDRFSQDDHLSRLTYSLAFGYSNNFYAKLPRGGLGRFFLESAAKGGNCPEAEDILIKIDKVLLDNGWTDKLLKLQEEEKIASKGKGVVYDKLNELIIFANKIFNILVFEYNLDPGLLYM